MGPPLQFRRTALITSLIRLAFGQPPSPKGEGYRRVLAPPLRRIQNDFVFLVGAGLRLARQDLHRERWRVKLRRGGGTALPAIFHPNRPP